MARDPVLAGELPADTPVGTRGRRTPVLALLLAIVVVVIAVGLVLHSRHPSNAKADAKVGTCTAGATSAKPTATGQIVNPTSKASTYVVRVRFKDAQGNAVSNGIASVNNVKSGATAKWQLTGDTAAKGPVTCEITGVTRTHLPGQ